MAIESNYVTLWPFYDKESKTYYNKEDLDKLRDEFSDFLILLSMVEANFVTVTLSEYYDLPARLIDMISHGLALKSDIRERNRKKD